MKSNKNIVIRIKIFQFDWKYFSSSSNFLRTIKVFELEKLLWKGVKIFGYKYLK